MAKKERKAQRLYVVLEVILPPGMSRSAENTHNVEDAISLIRHAGQALAREDIDSSDQDERSTHRLAPLAADLNIYVHSIHKEPPMVSGEWWLIDGQATAADGDTGDKNHDRHVWEYLLSEFADTFAEKLPVARDIADVLRKWSEDEGGDPVALRMLMVDGSDMLHRGGLITDEQCDDCYAWIREAVGWDETKWDVFFSNDSDARIWAVEHLGWIRVHGNACECWRLDRATRKSLADGLYDAYDEAALGETYLVEVWQPKRHHYNDVPFASLERGTAILANRSFT